MYWLGMLPYRGARKSMKDREAVEAICQTARNTGLAAYIGEVQLLEWAKSTSRDVPKVKFALADDDDIQPFEGATIRKGKCSGQRYILLAFEVRADESIEPAAEPKQQPQKKPYGEYARELHRLGWWWQPGVLEAIGSDTDFLAWVRQQPCAVTGEYDRNEDAHGNQVLRCEAAHVRRIANGAGTAEKPPYSAIPLVHYWHAQQTVKGESVFANGDAGAGRAWMDAARQKYVVAWASETLARALGAQSMGYVEPHILVAWAEAHGLGLPNKYHGGQPQ